MYSTFTISHCDAEDTAGQAKASGTNNVCITWELDRNASDWIPSPPTYHQPLPQPTESGWDLATYNLADAPSDSDDVQILGPLIVELSL